ncbi:glycosyltransferase family 25 protein [Gellertiella hungarica]|uniref:Glycosyl transferase family 25 n=1 Tax=Gellertiella hungarica TaxID=1572859 RepID=A0A7W6J451_9HYPH|nr:glycosyltransferase family 25 protein [Gellertiella hungarica]MBB4064471.1 glycosyl transferase family 25 [Gellertiella hungarica]
MKLPIYAINLDRSQSRWDDLQASAARQGLALTRVSAVDGRTVAEAERADASDAGFRRHAGRIMRPGEYGCYQSHLKALDLIVASGVPAAIIVEDDADFGPDFMARAEALLEACPQAEVIKLFNHRIRGFRKKAESRFGDQIGRCIHGPQGSAACYLVTASGAAKLARALRPMVLPFDVDLERGWKTGAATYTVHSDLISLGPLNIETEIGTREDYRQTRLPAWKRMPTHVFRAVDYARRMIYASLL